jgi:hypothetical protein
MTTHTSSIRFATQQTEAIPKSYGTASGVSSEPDHAHSN